MKINTNSVLRNYKNYIKKLNPITLDKIRFSTITSKTSFIKALEITETEREPEAKRIAYSLIEEAIKEMKVLKEPILVDNLFFAIAYPESYKLVKEYYKVLTETCLSNKKFMKFDGEKFSPFNNKSDDYVISRIRQIEQSTYTLYMSYFKDDEFLAKDGNFDKRAIENINHKYNLLNIFRNESAYDQKMAYEIYYLILDSDYTLEKIVKTYQKSAESIHEILSTYLKEEEYKNVLLKLKYNAAKKYNEIQSIIEKLYDYIPNGVQVGDGEKVPFTMVDYYSLTYLNPSTIIEEMEKRKPSNKEEAIARAKSKRYLSNNKKQGPNVNKEILSSKKAKIIKGTEVYSIEDYADELVNLFKENNIPSYSNLYETAFTRIARNIPVLPLKSKEDIKSL